MEKDGKRALRRHHRVRMIRKAVNIRLRQWGGFGLPSVNNKAYDVSKGYGFWYRSEFFPNTWESHVRYAKLEAPRWADNLAKCGCYMCGNPRRYAKGENRWTMQERRDFIRAREGRDEYPDGVE